MFNKEQVFSCGWPKKILCWPGAQHVPDYPDWFSEAPSSRRKRRAFISKRVSVPGSATLTVGRSEARVEWPARARSDVFGIVAGHNFDLHFEVVHLVERCDRHLELVTVSN